MPRLDVERHTNYFLHCLRSLPSPYTSLDTNRLTVAYFSVSALDLLGALDRVDAPSLIRWTYSQQLKRPAGAPADWAVSLGQASAVDEVGGCPCGE